MPKNINLTYSDDPLNILFITPNESIKAVYSTAILGKVIELCPRAKITLASSFAAAPLFAAAPHVTNIISWTKPCALRILPKIIFKRWDIIIDCQEVSCLPLFTSKLKAQNPTDLPAMIGYRSEDITPQIWLADEIIRGAEKRFFKKEHVIGIAPFTDSGEPIMPLKDLSLLIQELTLPGGIFASSPVAIFGFKQIKNKQLTDFIAKIPDWQRINLIGSLGLLSIAGCLEKCRFFFGGNSVISHIASTANVASIIVINDDKDTIKPAGRYTATIKSALPLDATIKAIDDLWHGKLQQK